MIGTPKLTASGFNFGTPTSTATGNTTGSGGGGAPAGGFQFASGDNRAGVTPQPAKPNFGFGLGITPLGSSTSATNIPIITPPTNASTRLNFNFNPSPNVQAAAAAPQLSFATPASKATTAASIFTPSISTTTITQATPSVGGFALATTPKTTSATSIASALSFIPPTATSTTTTVASITGFNLPSTTTTTAAGFSLGAPSSTTTKVAGILPATTTPATLTSLMTTTTTDSVIPSTGNLTFSQLEDAINKWTIDLEEQGKLFGNQAKQLNAWDRLLISNSEKILSLNNGIERVKQQQQQLDQELDFVLAQQKELEDLIVPLEKELIDLPATDLDRNQTYQMAENLDSQLKQMSEDLKEIIEHLNESNKSQELSNPITQIGKILNAHMDSLQWIDRNTTKITSHLDQISKMHDMNRRNHEMSLQRTYD